MIIVDSRESIYGTPNEDVDDDALMARVRDERDGIAFRQLHDRYHGRLRAMLARRGITRSDVDDLLQEIFRRVCLHAHNYHSHGKFRSWLWRLANNAYSSFLMRSRRFPPAVSITYDSIAAPPDLEATLIEDFDEITMRVTGANNRVLNGTAPGFQKRKAWGLLRCLSRLMHEIDAHTPYPVQVGSSVVASPAFEFLGRERKETYLDMLRQLGETPGTGNFRVDLPRCGLKVPGTQIWHEFVDALAKDVTHSGTNA